MTDKYPNFESLEQSEVAGVDFRIRLTRTESAFALVALHGGGIEPGTSELAEAVAGERFSAYSFEGLKSSGNSDLHLTSTHFDEPLCLTLLGRSQVVITIHGEQSEGESDGIFLGGLDDELGARIAYALATAGFVVRRHADPNLQGREPSNVCNRGTQHAGVQLELSRTVREMLFKNLTREGRKCTTQKFDALVAALSGVLAAQAPQSVTVTASTHGAPRQRGRRNV
jgi:phage replication-related protein YjqB (UPF0714/DUF867 family)